jgi:dCMP deaminase
MTDLDHLRRACLHAIANSDDVHTHVGAVLVQGGYYVLATNALPPGVRPTPERLGRPEKYRWIEHAERRAIYQAAANGVATKGATLYAPWSSCTDCARAIICAGIVEVVGLSSLRQATPIRWESEIRTAEAMLSEAGVGLRWLSGEVGVTIRFDGQDLSC